PAAGFYMTDAFPDTGLTFVNEHYADPHTAKRPFLLYLAYTAPHWPLHAPDSIVAKYEARYLSGWDAIRASRFEQMKASGVIDDRYTPGIRPDDITAWAAIADKKQRARKLAVYSALVVSMHEK